MGYFYDKVVEMREKGRTILPKTPETPVKKVEIAPKKVEKPVEKPASKKEGAKNDKGNAEKS